MLSVGTVVLLLVGILTPSLELRELLVGGVRTLPAPLALL